MVVFIVFLCVFIMGTVSINLLPQFSATLLVFIEPVAVVQKWQKERRKFFHFVTAYLSERWSGVTFGQIRVERNLRQSVNFRIPYSRPLIKVFQTVYLMRTRALAHFTFYFFFIICFLYDCVIVCFTWF